MVHFFMGMGIFSFPMIIIAIVILILAVKKAADLFGGGRPGPVQLEKGLHAILFWGAVEAVLGILGQFTGMYNALGAIGRAREISPQIVAQGFAESISTTMFGLFVLLISGIIWFVLFSRYKKLAAVQD